VDIFWSLIAILAVLAIIAILTMGHEDKKK